MTLRVGGGVFEGSQVDASIKLLEAEAAKAKAKAEQAAEQAALARAVERAAAAKARGARQ